MGQTGLVRFHRFCHILIFAAVISEGGVLSFFFVGILELRVFMAHEIHENLNLFHIISACQEVAG